MMEEGLCVGCGRESLDVIECACGREEISACEECRNSGVTLVSGNCRDRAVRVVPVGSYLCRDFMDDEAGTDGDPAGRMRLRAAAGA